MEKERAITVNELRIIAAIAAAVLAVGLYIGTLKAKVDGMFVIVGETNQKVDQLTIQVNQLIGKTSMSLNVK